MIHTVTFYIHAKFGAFVEEIVEVVIVQLSTQEGVAVHYESTSVTFCI